MAKRRALADLYVTGTKVYLTDKGEMGEVEDEVVVWVQKINQFEHEQCQRKANAAKAITLGIRNLDDDDTQRAEYNLSLETGKIEREDYITMMVNQDVERLRPAKEDELASEKPWSEDELFQGLMDAWDGGLHDEYLIDPEECSQAAKDTWNALQKFTKEVDKRLEQDERGFRRTAEEQSDEDLGREMTNRLIKLDADAVWIDVYTKWRIVYAVREIDDHSNRVLEDLDALNELQPQLIGMLREEYTNLSVDLLEGKD